MISLGNYTLVKFILGNHIHPCPRSSYWCKSWPRAGKIKTDPKINLNVFTPGMGPFSVHTGENICMLLNKYKSVNSLSPNHFYLLGLKIVIVFLSIMALRLHLIAPCLVGRTLRTEGCIRNSPTGSDTETPLGTQYVITAK